MLFRAALFLSALQPFGAAASVNAPKVSANSVPLVVNLEIG